MTRTDAFYKTLPAYMDAHCDAFMGRPYRELTCQYETQAADRGYQDGMKARESALRAQREARR